MELTKPDTKYPEQIEWAAKSEQILSKPANEITTADAKNVTAKEVLYTFPLLGYMMLNLLDSCIRGLASHGIRGITCTIGG